MWDNFTTYFNLYFNTATLFEDAENEILTQKRDLFSNEPLIISGNARTALTKVVEKSSKLLQFYSSSSYVDEALMMLGKSFYYQSNYQKSKRKFEELLATNPDDEITTESNLWIAKCSFELREFTEALKLIQAVRVKAIEKDYEKIIEESYVQEIKHRIKKEEYPLAFALANEFAEVYDDDVVRAQIYYELGNLYKQTNDNQNSLLAYEKVFDYEPDFDLEIIATIKYANALRSVGQAEKALGVFEGIRAEDKFLASYNEIDFEIGKTFTQLGQYDKAYDQFRLVDSTYKNTPFASASNFELGELYRTRFMNYDSAAYYYSKAATSNPPKEYLDNAKNNNQLFSKYSNLRKDINSLDRQFFYSQNPEIFSKDSSDYVADSLKLLTEYLEQKEMQDIWNGVDTMFNYKNPNLIDSTFIKDSIFVRDSLVKVDSLISLGLFNPADTIGLKKSILDSLNTKNLVKSKDSKNPQNLINQLQSGIKLDSVKFKNNPPQKLKISIDSAKTVLAKSSLELGNLFLTEFDVPDSAFNLYNIILDRYPSPVYYPNTLYALGSYYLTINDKPKADSLFDIIYVDYKDRAIVNAAANKLNKPLIDLKFDPAKDLYASAEELMLEGNYNQSLTKFYNIYLEHPKSLIAPQALYTTGWILENDLFLSDSAASVYDTLIAQYPGSVYVRQVSKKVTAYKQEKVRIQKAIQDSLNALNNLMKDSTLAANNIITSDTSDIVDDILALEEGNEVDKNIIIDPKNDALIDKKNTVVTSKKKLDPLWDPRKHFN
ncbi:MAG: tetratricopeptide repeat protein [Ignavibacteria bacterium]|nr:tetratricopeptide repeat protein [Ignavibacteria bacterium]